MPLQFRTVRLKKIGAEAATPDRQWASLNVGFLNEETDHFSGVKVQFVVPKNRDMSLRELEEAARVSALEVLAAAHKALSEGTLEELESQQAALEQE
jgi:hypothetical protein